MDATLILADRLVQLLKDAGTTKAEASAALGIAGTVVMASNDIPVLSQDELEQLYTKP